MFYLILMMFSLVSIVRPAFNVRLLQSHRGALLAVLHHLSPDTGERAPPQPQPCRLVLGLLTPGEMEG